MSRENLPPFIQVKKEGIVLALAVQAGAKKSELLGPSPDGFLKIRVSAPAHEGKANRELVRFLAEIFSLRQSQVQIISGEKSRKKLALLTPDISSDIGEKLKIILSKTG